MGNKDWVILVLVTGIRQQTGNFAHITGATDVATVFESEKTSVQLDSVQLNIILNIDTFLWSITHVILRIGLLCTSIVDLELDPLFVLISELSHAFEGIIMIEALIIHS